MKKMIDWKIYKEKKNEKFKNRERPKRKSQLT